MARKSCMHILLAAALATQHYLTLVEAFAPLLPALSSGQSTSNVGGYDIAFNGNSRRNSFSSSSLYAKKADNNKNSRKSSPSDLRPVPSDQEGVPIPFVDTTSQSFIECYADSIAQVDGVEYTIGVPCDYAVALCYFREDQQLIPIELNDPLMDEIYPIAESIVEEEFGEELVLQRTPQTLTLVGELEEDEDEEDDDFDLDEDDDEEDDGDEEVEVLLSFEQDGRQYNLVRMLDPMLLVGKMDSENPQNRILLTPEESDKVMPVLEEMFLEFRENRDDVLP